MKKIIILIFSFFLISCSATDNNIKNSDDDNPKLYWFIPDGMRADPDLFNIFEWAEAGELPNIKIMMDNGAYGFMIPVFPSHTPVNFATLLTGSYPKTHGIVDGPMHVEGMPLDKVAVPGFRSTARKVPAIWSTLEDNGKEVFVLSTPGSTPPEIDNGVVVRGRWGGWGADFHAVNFESRQVGDQRKKQGRGSRLFYVGPELTQYLDFSSPDGWDNVPESYSNALEVNLSVWGLTIFAYIYDTSNDGNINYDRIIFSKDKKEIIADLKEGEWRSKWHNVDLRWQGMDINSDIMINVIILDKDGFFRVRFLFNNLNKFITEPGYVSSDLTSGLGPMVDFVDNFPPQLIYYSEDKDTFLHEMKMSFEWHKKAIPFILEKYQPDAIIHDIYSPNQMLTSRWWLGYVDPKSKRYYDVSEEERKILWDEVKSMYKELDAMIGKILNNVDNNTILVLSSDHGASVLNKWVRVNNLLAKNGLLKFEIDDETGEPIIDWENSKAIYLKMDNIYVHPEGLAGNWTRASGPQYEVLRDKVTKILLNLEDEEGIRPVVSVTRWEDVEKFLDLSTDRVGDLIIANEAGYGWNEEMTNDLEIFSIPLKTGYKQAIYPEEEKSMWTPFIIMGPGIKKGYEIKEPGEFIDQYPTIMKLLEIDTPYFVDGKAIYEIFDE